MQLLIVHHDVEVGEQLAAMIQDYTEHHCGFARSAAAALEWARSAARCSLLITQLDGEGVNGLSLGANISEMFAGLQTMFLPAYRASEQRLEVPHPKVFPEPIDGQRLLDAIAHAEAQRQTGLDLYHALDVIQMCCLSRRSGALQLVRGSEAAVVFLQHGEIADAETGAARGADALDVISGWAAVEFAYDYSLRAPVRTVETTWDEALVAAIERRHAREARAQGAAEPPSGAPSDPPSARRGLFGGRKFGLL